MKQFGIALAVLVFTPALALAHPGGLDKHGCHHDKKAGDYHCHKGDHKGMSFSKDADMLAGKPGTAMKAAEKKDEKKAETKATTKK
jgi:hypothetical protein